MSTSTARKTWESLTDEAKHLVALNHSEVRSISKSYVFPDPKGEEIRVVHIDSKVFPEEAVIPIRFSPDPQYRLYHPMFIAIMDPTGPARVEPPHGWGQWKDAFIIERRKRRTVE